MLIGGGSWLSPITSLLVVWSALFHCAGMIANELFDLKHDLEAGKTFKPLVSGKIKVSSTTTFLLIIQTILGGLGCFISPNITALFWMFFALFSSIIYNLLSKTMLKIFLLGNIWVGTALFGYFTQASEFNLLILLFVFYVWFMFNMDAMYVGQYKDPRDRKNILEILGAVHNPTEFIPSWKTSLLIWMATGTKIWLAIAIWFVSGSGENSLFIIPLALSVAFLYWETEKISRPVKNFGRLYATRRAVLHEIATAFLLASSLVSVLGGLFELFLVMFTSVSLLIVVNRCMCGRWGITPDV